MNEIRTIHGRKHIEYTFKTGLDTEGLSKSKQMRINSVTCSVKGGQNVKLASVTTFGGVTQRTIT
jgi:hypothetical protein